MWYIEYAHICTYMHKPIFIDGLSYTFGKLSTNIEQILNTGYEFTKLIIGWTFDNSDLILSFRSHGNWHWYIGGHTWYQVLGLP